MRCESLFHLRGAAFEYIEKIAMPAFKIFEHVAQLLQAGFGIELKYPVYYVVGPGLIGWVEIPRFSRRLERTHDDPGGIWTQI